MSKHVWIASDEPKILLIDSDALVYRCGFACEKKKYLVSTADGIYEGFERKRDMDVWIANYMMDCEGRNEVGTDLRVEVQPVEFALHAVDTVVKAIAERFPGSPMEFYVAGEGNFRKELATLQEYKGNRKDVARPVHYDSIREFLINKYNATQSSGQETDDDIGIRATELGDGCVMVHTDKDINTIAGWHYGWVERNLYYLDEVEAARCFYSQLLTGDPTDNIPGLVGVGEKTAAKILRKYSSPKGMWQAVLAEYSTKCPEGFMGRGVKDALLEIGNLLYIRKQSGQVWTPP